MQTRMTSRYGKFYAELILCLVFCVIINLKRLHEQIGSGMRRLKKEGSILCLRRATGCPQLNIERAVVSHVERTRNSMKTGRDFLTSSATSKSAGRDSLPAQIRWSSEGNRPRSSMYVETDRQLMCGDLSSSIPITSDSPNSTSDGSSISQLGQGSRTEGREESRRFQRKASCPAIMTPLLEDITDGKKSSELTASQTLFNPPSRISGKNDDAGGNTRPNSHKRSLSKGRGNKLSDSKEPSTLPASAIPSPSPSPSPASKVIESEKISSPPGVALPKRMARYSMIL